MTPQGGNFTRRGNSDGKESSEGQQDVEVGEEGSAAGAEFEEEVVGRVNGAPVGIAEPWKGWQPWLPALSVFIG